MAGAGTTLTALCLHNCSQSFQFSPSLLNQIIFELLGKNTKSITRAKEV